MVRNLSFKDSVLLLNGVLGDFGAEENGENIDLKNLSDKPFFGVISVINESWFVVASAKEMVVSFFVELLVVSSSTGLTKTFIKIKQNFFKF